MSRDPIRWEEAIQRHRDTGIPLIDIFAEEARRDVERYFVALLRAYGVTDTDEVLRGTKVPNYEEVEQIVEKMLHAAAAVVSFGSGESDG